MKGQVVDSKGVSAWGYGGQTLERGDWIEGKAIRESCRSAQRVEEAGRAVRARTARHRASRSSGVSAEPNRGLARSSACRTRTTAAGIGKHASHRGARVPAARIQDRERLKPILKGSIAFTRRIDQAAACMYALQREVCGAENSRTRCRAAGLPFVVSGLAGLIIANALHG